MKVDGKNLTTIWYDENADEVKIIDQRLLPHKLKIVNLNSLEQIIFSIKEMQVRGAPLIGITAAYGMYIASKKNSNLENLIKAGKLLKNTRPTAVNLSWAVDKILRQIEDIDSDKRSETILNLANQIRQQDIDACEKIGENGFKLLKKIYENKKNTINILTHCNAGWLATVDWGTALSPIFKANKNNIPIHVWVDETRPRNQGFNLTAWLTPFAALVGGGFGIRQLVRTWLRRRFEDSKLPDSAESLEERSRYARQLQNELDNIET